MPSKLYNLAIETASRPGSITLGLGEQLLGTIELPDSVRNSPTPNPRRRNTLDLMPAIDLLTRRHSVTPSSLSHVFVSIGPGSFTGLRIAIATAKTLASVLNIKLVAVPTTQVVAQNASSDSAVQANLRIEHLAVYLNQKRDTVYAQLFRRHSKQWVSHSPAILQTIHDLLAAAPRPLAIIGHPIPEVPNPLRDGVTFLDPQAAVGHSDRLWELGIALAAQGRFTPPHELLPLYARPPEAQTLWAKRHTALPSTHTLTTSLATS